MKISQDVMKGKNGEHGNTPSMEAELLGAELLFTLLARLLLTHPDQETLERVVAERLFEEMPLSLANKLGRHDATLLARWSRERAGTLSESEFEALEIDYSRLFEGPGQVLAPPWESVYFNENRLTFQEETLAVRRWYRRFGLESLKVRKEPDDHVGLELSFLAYLIGKTIEALEQEGSAAAAYYLEAQRQFLAEHLGKWIDLWTERVQAEAKTDFWPGVALLAEGAVLFWREWLTGEIPEMVAS